MRPIVNKHRQTIIAATIAIVFVAIIAILTRPAPQMKLDCYEDRVNSMTIQEVSDLLDTALIELTWLPYGMKLVPNIKTYPSYFSNDPNLSECSITLDYVNPSLPQQHKVSIWFNRFSSIQATKEPTLCSLRYSPVSTIDTYCSIDIDSQNNTLDTHVTFSADFTREDTLRVLEGIKVVEPAIEPTPTPTA